ncbi:MAG: DUF4339 domain-containing protein [Rhodospirillaceae bacterium]|nr:DUF4339 domain-containing protein [Rhodospirillaceae bacterium]
MRMVLVLVFVFLLAASAKAEDMSGRYQGPAPENTILDLVQTGAALQGTLLLKSGAQGTLQGQATGDTGKGSITIPGLGQADFEAHYSPQGLLIRIFEEGQVTDAMFVRIGPPTAAQPQVQTQVQAPVQPQAQAQPALPAQPQPQQPQVTYYVAEGGAPVGPFALPELTERAQAGTLKPDQQVWTSATQSWGRADGLPELRGAFATAAGPAASVAVTYYVAENGAAVGPLTLQQVIERIHAGTSGPDQQVWRSDGQAWVRADSLPELQAAFRQAGPPPSAPAAPTYYVGESGAAVGPLTLEQVQARARAGGLAPDQPVWRSDSQAWVRADSLPELRDSLKPAASESPPAGPTPPVDAGGTEPPYGVPAQQTAPQGALGGAEAAPAVDEALRQTALAIATADNPEGSSRAVSGAAQCLVAALARLTPDDRQQLLLDVKTGTPPDEARRLDQEFPGLEAAVNRLEPRYPGIGAAIEACI